MNVMDSIDEYDYELPKDLIAQFPLTERSESRLLVVNRSSGVIEHANVRDLPNLLSPKDALVLNDTQVVPARLRGTRLYTAGKWEGLFISAQDESLWQILSKTRGKIQAGERVRIHCDKAAEDLQLEFIQRMEGGIWIVRPSRTDHFVKILNSVGQIPLPPYIRGGQMEASDLQSYQTVYAANPGAVAAPTAGLHFTQSLLDQLSASGLSVEKVTLHVGIGTFRPIDVKDLAEHNMHSEWGQLQSPVAERLIQRKSMGGRIISVGTTSVRVLETASLDGVLAPWHGFTDLFIKPGFTFNSVDGLLTNFHLPKSSLLVLVSTFAGHDLIREAYAKAVEAKYRFYSYGDAMLIL